MNFLKNIFNKLMNRNMEEQVIRDENVIKDVIFVKDEEGNLVEIGGDEDERD